MPTEHHRHDVVVVGARAAGAATALLLARLGHDVALVERAVFPADTVSTHQIARPGVVLLHRWGLLDDVLASGAPAIRRVTFTAAGESVARTVKHRAGVDLLVAPRRHILDTLVAEAAVKAGARLIPRAAVRGLRVDTAGRVTGVRGRTRSGADLEIAARYVVGADGLRSTVRRAAGAEVLEFRGDRGAVQYAYFHGPAWDGIELHLAERALAGVFPTHDDEACVWIATPSAAAHAMRHRTASRTDAFTTLLDRAAPGLAGRLRTARRTSPVAGMLRSPNILRRAYGPGWALAGDAGYHRDAVTGLGISDAYRDAQLLATALDRVLRGDTDERTALAGYQADRDRALRGHVRAHRRAGRLPTRVRVRRTAEGAQPRHRRRGGRGRRARRHPAMRLKAAHSARPQPQRKDPT